MKVLREGKLPGPPPPPWPIDVEIVCTYCACRFVPETYADFTITAEKHPGGRYAAELVCPTCRRGVMINRSVLPLEA